MSTRNIPPSVTISSTTLGMAQCLPTMEGASNRRHIPTTRTYKNYNMLVAACCTSSKGLSGSANPYLFTSSPFPCSPYVLYTSSPAFSGCAATMSSSSQPDQHTRGDNPPGRDAGACDITSDGDHVTRQRGNGPLTNELYSTHMTMH